MPGRASIKFVRAVELVSERIWRIGRAIFGSLTATRLRRITIHAGATSYNLDRTDRAWKIGGPIEAEAMGSAVEPLANELANLKAERFESNAKDLAGFGLDKPAFKIDVCAQGRQASLALRRKSTEGGRYAKLGDKRRRLRLER